MGVQPQPSPQSSSSVSPKRAKSGRTTSSRQGEVDRIEPSQHVPKLIKTRQVHARAVQDTQLKCGATTRVWVSLEHGGKEYIPGEQDLLVADLTSGWMSRGLVGQGLKKEFDKNGDRRWCMFVYQPTDGKVKYIPTDYVVSKVLTQYLEED